MKFLVVDDSPTMRRIVCNALRDIGYSEVVEAEDGQIALEKLDAHTFEFIITDWNMPVMNGLDLTKSIRSHDQMRNVARFDPIQREIAQRDVFRMVAQRALTA